jgi:predicted permease
MSWWRRLLKRGEMERHLDAELRFHFDGLVANNLRAGMSEPEARRSARLEFGGVEQVKEECRDARGTRWIEDTLRDLRFGVRILSKSKGLTAILILTLALGIGANTAIFSLVNQILLHPPGISQPERLIAIRARSKSINNVNVSPPVLADVRDSRQLFDHAAAARPLNLNYTTEAGPLRLTACAVSVEWFDVFGAKPDRGRVFVPEEDQPGTDHVVVLAYSAWVRLFGADAAVVGRTIELSEQRYKVIGVMGPDFEQPTLTDLWVPLALPPEAFAPSRRNVGDLLVNARTRPGVGFSQASALLQELTVRAWNDGSPFSSILKNTGTTIYGIPFIENNSPPGTRMALLVLLGAVGMVLLIACANVAGIMLARTSGRAHEIAVRAALGASRGRLMRQLLSESILLSFAGAILGLVVARGGTNLLLKLAPEGVVAGNSVPLDVYVLLFTAATAIISGIVFGAAPAWQLSKVDAVTGNDALKGSTRNSTAEPARQGLRSGLVILEMGLAIVLLLAAGLVLRSLAALKKIDTGFNSRGVMTAMFALPAKEYPDTIRQSAFYRAVLERLANTKGVTSSGISVGIPFGNWISGLRFEIEGHPPATGEPLHEAVQQSVTPGYFETLKIPLRRGRFINEQDRLGSQPVAVIDEALSRQYWPNEDALGKQISTNRGKNWIRIVGIVGHTLKTDLTADFGWGLVYFSVLQETGTHPPAPIGWIVARTDGNPRNVAAAIRDAVRTTDKNQPVDQLKSLDELIARSLATRRFLMRLLEFFAATAMFMAALGLYGVISFSVTRRTQEIGIRIALGAEPAAVRNMVIREGMRLALIGVVIGIGAALGLARLLSSLLFGVQPHDPLVFITVPVILTAVALLACYLPARRATRINPVEALRWE